MQSKDREGSWKIYIIYSKQNMKNIAKVLNEEIYETDSTNLLIAGDFNARIGQKDVCHFKESLKIDF